MPILDRKEKEMRNSTKKSEIKKEEKKGIDPGKLYTAPEFASMCQVDLKTVHNWVQRGQIVKYFRTPGRHLRFIGKDVIEFLETWGFPLDSE